MSAVAEPHPLTVRLPCELESLPGAGILAYLPGERPAVPTDPLVRPLTLLMAILVSLPLRWPGRLLCGRSRRSRLSNSTLHQEWGGRQGPLASPGHFFLSISTISVVHYYVWF